MARQIHDTIEGCGYSYRQTVGRSQIDFRLYDKHFQRATYDTKEAAVLIALCRLRYPMELLGWAEGVVKVAGPGGSGDKEAQPEPGAYHTRGGSRIDMMGY